MTLKAYINDANSLNLMDIFSNSRNESDISAFKAYVEDNFNPAWGMVKYDYALQPDIFKKNVDNGGNLTGYTQLNPLFERVKTTFLELFDGSFGAIIGGGGLDLSQFEDALSMIEPFVNSLAVWDEMPANDIVS